jgi:hypothetical protein
MFCCSVWWKYGQGKQKNVSIEPVTIASQLTALPFFVFSYR